MSTINPNLRHIMGAGTKPLPPLDYYLKGIIEEGDFLVLAEAITLLESDRKDHAVVVNQILEKCHEHRALSRRIGVTGTPGVGKSSWINSMAEYLMRSEGRMAVLTIDPTSTDQRGSILGDKTRMEHLVQNDRIFIRPSPSRLHLGGVHEYTHEAICMCEAAGIELILVETVGVGQSEHEIRDLVDCTLLLLLPGAGDDLQGIKKGITEIADIVVINKADGDRIALADRIKKDYIQANHMSRGKSSEWIVPVLKYSSLTGDGRTDMIDTIQSYFDHVCEKGFFSKNRDMQEEKWMTKRVEQIIMDKSCQVAKESKQMTELFVSSSSPYQKIATLRDSLSVDIKLL